MQLTFDTKQIYRNLSAEGVFTKDQAEKLTDALRDAVTINTETLATKSDLFATKTELKAEVDLVRAEIDMLRLEMKDMENRMTIKMGGIMVGGLTLLLAIQQLIAGFSG